MDGFRDYHTKWSEYEITYMWDLNYDTDEHIYETGTDTENSLMTAKEEGAGGMEQEAGASRCKLCMEWMDKVMP